MFNTAPLQYAIKKLLVELPGKKKFTVVINSQLPAQIIELLSTLKEYDTILLTQVDVWRYSNSPALLSYFDANKHQNFFIQTVGIADYKLDTNVWVLSYNPLYWSRERSTLRLKDSNTPFGFSSLNNRLAYHRALLGVKLFEQSILNQVMYSLGTGDPGEYLLQQLSKSVSWAEFKKQLPITVDGPSWQQDLGNGTQHPAFELAYANISTETETEYIDPTHRYPTPTVTEKTWKPFLSCQIPVWLASPGHMEFIRSLGFECFEKLWPDNFDQMVTEQKVDCIVDLVKLGKENIKQIYFDHIDQIKHNWELVNSDKIEQLMFDRAVKFIYN